MGTRSQTSLTDTTSIDPLVNLQEMDELMASMKAPRVLSLGVGSAQTESY